MAEKINQIEINGTTYDLQDKDAKAPFTGTKAEVQSAITAGEIKEGDIVNITDDIGDYPSGASNIVYLTKAEYEALPDSKLTNGVEYRITDANTDSTKARNIAYDNSESGIDAVSVQDAIDKVSDSLGGFTKIYNYTELMSGSLNYSHGNIIIQKYGKLVIASVMLYFNNALSVANHQLLSRETLNSIGCAPAADYINVCTASVDNGAKIQLFVDNTMGLGIYPFVISTVGDNFRCQLVWVTN